MNGKFLRLIQIVGQTQKQEVNKMSRKSLFEILIGLGLFAVFVLAVNMGASSNAVDTSGRNLTARGLGTFVGFDRAVVDNSKIYAGSDWIERNPSQFFAGSDFLERHRPAAAKAVDFTGSDFYERHRPATKIINYDGSDWIERHPPAAAKTVNYTGSDWIERHPLKPYWIEPNPVMFYEGSDYYERHPDQPTR
jgi:hypothetical protein